MKRFFAIPAVLKFVPAKVGMGIEHVIPAKAGPQPIIAATSNFARATAQAGIRSLLLSAALLPAFAHAELFITIAQGLGGMPEYENEFTEVREKVAAASATLTGEDKVFTFSGAGATREALLAHFKTLQERMTDGDRAAIYLIGHGSFDGEEYKYNIPGPDLTTDDLKGILESLPGQNHVLITTGSTSGALVEGITGVRAARDENDTRALEAMAATPSKYLIVAGTRNGNERNATHFGRFFAEALVSSAADVNKNDTVSVQEAYDYAPRAVEEYFDDNQRLATEHAQLRGEGAAQFSLSRLNTLEYESDDPELSELIEQRIALDAEIEELQLRRNEFASNREYLQALQALVLESAQLTERIDAARAAAGETVPQAQQQGPAQQRPSQGFNAPPLVQDAIEIQRQPIILDPQVPADDAQ